MDQRPIHKTKTIKFLEENIRGNLHDIELGNDFLDRTPKALTIKAKVDNWNILQNLCPSRDTINRVKSQFMEWEYLQITYLIRG